tara:strand:- start:13056 stop:14024 length:969 start_codon:yes stop_codon:yes gene_type:complete
MAILLNGDCLELLDTIEDKSVDLIYCDLPYASNTFGKCVSCEWDKPIDLEKLWSKLMKKKKERTPIFMSCNVKLGYELIKTAPKKCPFRYDLVWIKSSSSGFLNSKRMPLRSHELIYVFYEKLPFYDLSSHKNKFIDKEDSVEAKDGTYGKIDIKQPKTAGARWDPPLPNSVLPKGAQIHSAQVKGENNIYGSSNGGNIGNIHGPNYEPPLPDSVIKGVNNTYNTEGRKKPIQRLHNEAVYEPPLPDSILEVKSTRGKHSTEKPVDLIKWILKYYSKEGDIVLDATMGSGSTGVACKEMKRDFIGIEMNPEIYEVAVNRIEP